MKTIILWATSLGLGLLLAGCGGGGGTAGGGTTTTTTTQAKSITLSSTATSVKTDNSDSVTITATVADDMNRVLPGQTVVFSTTSGLILASSRTTDNNGQVSATFRSGMLDYHNRTAVITASIPGTAVSSSLPIQISGSSLTAAVTTNTPRVGEGVRLTVTTKIANGNPAPNQPLRFDIDYSSTGSANLSTKNVTTNTNGDATVIVTGTATGQVNILIEWLDADGNTTLRHTQTLTIQPSAEAFAIVTPADSPSPVTLGATQTIKVKTPATINGVDVSRIRYATTLGTWRTNNQKVLTVVRTNDTDEQTFDAGLASGNATIQIDAISSTGEVLATLKTVLALSASAASAASITLQPSVSVLAPSSANNLSTATLTATVRDGANNAVGGASVLFELVNPTGSGESIDPVVVSTNSSGIATATFIAGTNATTQTSQIRASVIGSSVTPATANITVGGTAGSVAIGTSTTITSVNNDTSYRLPVTVMVTDANGNAVGGATVSLSLWPVSYSRGVRTITALGCTASISSTRPNEDVNENLNLDPGEDVDGPGGNEDGALWPPLPSAGTIPATVLTRSDGTATFDWIYLKEYADWIVARLRARVPVQGTEATTTVFIRLPASKDDLRDCVLPDSPFGP